MAGAVYDALARSHPDDPDPTLVREAIDADPGVREALNWMWPVLTPAQLLHDLLGSAALIRSAGPDLSDAERSALHRPWHASRDGLQVMWTVDDVPLLDEARALLGPVPRRKRQARSPDDEVRTYGHIVVDEAQDLSPLQLRMLTRRSLNGSMTVVGDIAQSTGAWAHNDWQEVLEHLPNRRPSRRAELTVGYRIPGPSMALAARLLPYAAPDLAPPTAVRSDGDEPRFVAVDPEQSLADAVVVEAQRELEHLGQGNVAVIVPASLVAAVAAAFERSTVAAGIAPRDGLDNAITVVPVGFVKGLEVDVAVVVDPAAILAEEPQGYRSLYVALTRATQRLCLVHQRPLPTPLA